MLLVKHRQQRGRSRALGSVCRWTIMGCVPGCLSEGRSAKGGNSAPSPLVCFLIVSLSKYLFIPKS